jgi:hypothetical protein
MLWNRKGVMWAFILNWCEICLMWAYLVALCIVWVFSGLEIVKKVMDPEGIVRGIMLIYMLLWAI